MFNYKEFKTLRVHTLEPEDSHVSFYGKAKIIETITEQGTIVFFLQSYETIVAAIDGSEFTRLWDGYSATTMRHIKAFVARYGNGHDFPRSKAAWCALDTERSPIDTVPFNWNRVSMNDY